MRRMLAAAASLFLSVPVLALPTGIYFFGDSLTDVGNASAVYATLPHAPGDPATIPGPPYDPPGGGKRGSNGKLYADVLAEGDRKSTRLNSSHVKRSRMPSSA